MIEDQQELSLRVSDFAAMCAKKLREEGSAAYDVTTFLYTNRFRDDMNQYFPSMTIRLNVAANSTQEIVSAALKAFRLIYRTGYQYKKAGVVVGNIIPQESVQGAIFDFDECARQKNDRISKVMDSLGGQSKLLRLGVQRPGHYADGIRTEHRSGLYTTSLDEIINVH
jgi:DNA polymerase V